MCDLFRESMCDGEPPAYSERFRSDSEPRRGLLAFVFVAVDLSNNVPHQVFGNVLFARNFRYRLVTFNVSGKNGVENRIIGQAVGVLLVGTKLRGRGFRQSVFGNRSE